ncbi:hypothetical protein RM780_16830 [Streptomyces sp. DSM 44917]|uniref:Uncharacterized protein n=1 Tax=Streptomyces boetiae TaxID=3075541 RepID=A0ABU2LAL9_9ACTN|nr:hypothetical protein [Streptomyces sp. DSM 44917]MDT0308611.1 hypothetical protein [Streptomyces sp. DSM 44917]
MHAKEQPGTVVGVTVDPGTVRVGDQMLFAGQAFTVADLTVLPGGGRRLAFESGEAFLMRSTTVLYAMRRVPARRFR